MRWRNRPLASNACRSVGRRSGSTPAGRRQTTAGSRTPAAEPLVDRVRSSCARTAERATLVHIDHAALASYDPGGVDSASPEPSDVDERAARLVFALDAINFGSGYHDHVSKRPGCSGAVTMAQALTEHEALTGPITSAWLRSVTPADCTDIFGQPRDDGPVDELMASFSRALNDLGAFLDDHGGQAATVIEAAEGSAVRLAESLTSMPFYRDEATLDGDTVCFYKRAQITAADLGRRWPLFSDLHQLTAFADNLVPHVLMVDGVLQYESDLASAIAAGESLRPGSRAEIEIRAAGVHAVELLAARLPARPMDLDAALWHRGAGAIYKARPRHRSRSVFY